MKSPEGRKIQAEYNKKVEEKVVKKYQDKVGTWKLQCGNEHASHGSIKYCKKFIEMDRSAKLSALQNS